jgi:hypothetical protein
MDDPRPVGRRRRWGTASLPQHERLTPMGTGFRSVRRVFSTVVGSHGEMPWRRGAIGVVFCVGGLAVFPPPTAWRARARLVLLGHVPLTVVAMSRPRDWSKPPGAGRESGAAYPGLAAAPAPADVERERAKRRNCASKLPRARCRPRRRCSTPTSAASGRRSGAPPSRRASWLPEDTPPGRSPDSVAQTRRDRGRAFPSHRASRGVPMGAFS